MITAVVPPAAEPVSLRSAAAFSVHCSEHGAVAAHGVEVLGRVGAGARYAAGDATAVAWDLGGGG